MTHRRRRSCFLCGCKTGEQLFDEEWEIAGIECVGIGVRICSGCGLVLQDPVVPPGKMSKYYSLISNYSNPGRSGRPSNTKVAAVDRYLSFAMQHVPEAGNAFQVGCSNGYTLHRFQEAGWLVMGVDPSPVAINVAETLWGLDLEVGFFEDYTPTNNKKYDLIILTHILEHIYDPVEVLEKCGEMLCPNGRLLIEVPVLVEPTYWPPGYFTLEHLNYFSTQSMINLLSLCGFEIDDNIIVYLEGDQYPVMTCIVRRKAAKVKEQYVVSDFENALQICNQYLELEAKEWRRIDSLLREALQGFKRVVIWGAGIHTSQLLARTNITSNVSIDYIVDSDSQKWGMMLGEYSVKAPEQVQFADQSLAIVISSCSSEGEIFQVIAGRSELKCQVIKLYEGDICYDESKSKNTG